MKSGWEVEQLRGTRVDSSRFVLANTLADSKQGSESRDRSRDSNRPETKCADRRSRES
ncbi:hypothetical protein NJ7G_0467 [Natrinema sp. J7-2]|nr:hypothetical protein NJ7G_0467 [Natrinema sp. J7-2]